MRILCKSLLAVGLAVLVASPALAQRGPGGRGGNPLGMLLNNEDVQKELKLSKEQVDKAKKALAEVSAKYEDDQKAIRELPQEERGPKMQELGKKISAESNEALAKVFDKDQTKRFKQITLQQSAQRRGPAALNDAEVVTTLKLTEDQQAKIKAIAEDTSKEVRSLFTGGGTGGRPDPETMKKVQTLNKEALEKAAATLTDDQKKTWKDMLGTAFEIKFTPRGAPRPPAGGDRDPK